MNELLKHLTAAEKLKVEEALRQTVSDMNGNLYYIIVNFI